MKVMTSREAYIQRNESIVRKKLVHRL